MPSRKIRKCELTDSIVAALPIEKNAKGNPTPYDVRDTLVEKFLVRVERSGKKGFFIILDPPLNSKNGKAYRFRLGDASDYRLFKRPQPADPQSIREKARRVKVQSENTDFREQKKQAIAATKRERVSTLLGFIDNVYRDYYANEKGASSPDATLKTIKNQFPALCAMKLNSIDDLTIERWKTAARKPYKLKNGKTRQRSEATLERYADTLQGIFAYAVIKGVMDRNPLASAERKRSGLKLPKSDSDPIERHLTDAEYTRLMETLEARDNYKLAQRRRTIAHRKKRNLEAPPEINGIYYDYLTPLVILALETGVRRGGLLGLKWSDIRDGHLNVRIATDKSAKGYSVPLSNNSIEVLRKWKRQTSGSDLVFTHRGQPIKEIRKAWGTVLRDAKIANFRFHDCRHHYAVNLVQKNVPIAEVAQNLGHSTLQMTMRYAKYSPGHRAATLEALNG